MADLNMCLFTGRLGKDPEVKYLASGDAACNTSIAVSKKWKDKTSGETKEATTWVPCQFYGKTAELLGQYAKKGTQIRVTGEFTVRKYQDQSGTDRYATEIKVQDFQLLGGRPDGAAPAPAPAARPPAAARRPAAEAPPDDIPF